MKHKNNSDSVQFDSLSGGWNWKLFLRSQGRSSPVSIRYRNTNIPSDILSFWCNLIDMIGTQWHHSHVSQCCCDNRVVYCSVFYVSPVCLLPPSFPSPAPCEAGAVATTVEWHTCLFGPPPLSGYVSVSCSCLMLSRVCDPLPRIGWGEICQLPGSGRWSDWCGVWQSPPIIYRLPDRPSV